MRLPNISLASEMPTVEQPLEVNRFRMEVPETGYKWLEDAYADSPFTDKKKLGSPPYLVLDDRGQTEVLLRSYFPLREVPDLFCRFRDLALDAEGILRFANQFGSIGETSQVIGLGGSPLIPTVGLSRWHEEIQASVIAHHLWECIKVDDRRSLRQHFKWHPTKFDVDLSIGIQGKEVLSRTHPYVQNMPTPELVLPAHAHNTWLIDEHEAEALRSVGWNSGDVLGPARLALMNIVNPRLQEYCHPRLYLDKDRGFVGHLTPINLLGCIWMQFYLSIIGQLKLRRCTVCGIEMDVTESRGTKKMHVRCSKSRRMQKWRRARKGGRAPISKLAKAT